VFQEAENRLHVQKAIMLELMKDIGVASPRDLVLHETVRA
jgi:hypothetical protein